ncbi:MetQ/NlpA family ABC transporter substrate-binding protein [Streptomonospora sp. S1-112]|uniref:Lipoprotein n=1 Tax=Streptomonospora mangrovi TaxID=2883123 RepID=A0A9X3NSQ2_9ACTN|nr:MetQ/NlpA family ABC transporter substrate-binding protein [Streptomonospora mangrovi]MDA0567354.1 MetQ/NlpA family ABC transporter substrate-binding protein [Streptomonospora mangrovi]
MNTELRKISGVLGAAALAVGLSACGSPSEQAAEEDSGGGDRTTVRVGATPVPHAEVLRFVQEELAADAGLDIEIVEFTDYNQPNAALAEGEIDANYFQTKPFLADYEDGNPDADLTWVSDVHLEAFGLYSETLEEVGGIERGAEIAVPSDASNMGRALNLLDAEGIITLAEGAGETAGEGDIEENPKDVELVPVDAAQLPRSLADVDAAVVNGNFALEAGLAESANALAWEETEGSPYGNGLVVPAGHEDDESIAKLDELLHSDEVRTFMEEEWDGVVLPLEGGGES